MSLTSALFASVAGLQSQSRQLSAISENVANSSTTAYKSREVHFEALVTNGQGTASSFATGSVTTEMYQNIDAQGLIQNTGELTEIALNGAGFFVVSDNTNGQPNEYNYTRNGDFTLDKDGFMLNNEGYFLYGQQTDDNGNVLATNSNDLNSLTPINVNQVTGTASPTANIELDANLPADLQTDDTPGVFVIPTTNNTIDYGSTGAPGTTPGGNITLDVTDELGAVVNTVINVEAQADDLALAAAIDAVAGISASYDAVNDQIIVATQQGTDTVDIAFDAAAENAFAQPAATATFESSAPELPVNYPFTTTIEVFDSLGISHSFDIIWEKDVDTQNLWQATLSSLYVTGDENKIPTGTIDTGDGDAVIDIEFNGDGTLSYADGDGDAEHDPDGITLQITGLTASTGADDFITATGTAITLDMGSPDRTDGMTQFSSNSVEPDIEISLVDQDGVRYGELSSYEISEDGIVTGLFDNGLRQTIFQIPIGTFPNAGGLTHIGGTVYDENQTAGNLNLRKPGEGSAGKIVPNSLELSTTDTADEFNKMIIAQQAYSAASQVLSTTDEMFDSLIQAVR